MPEIERAENNVTTQTLKSLRMRFTFGSGIS
jgi:hypothetical protein